MLLIVKDDKEKNEILWLKMIVDVLLALLWSSHELKYDRRVFKWVECYEAECECSGMY